MTQIDIWFKYSVLVCSKSWFNVRSVFGLSFSSVEESIQGILSPAPEIWRPASDVGLSGNLAFSDNTLGSESDGPSIWPNFGSTVVLLAVNELDISACLCVWVRCNASGRCFITFASCGSISCCSYLHSISFLTHLEQRSLPSHFVLLAWQATQARLLRPEGPGLKLSPCLTICRFKLSLWWFF